ncbi:MAG: hypothetical protein J1E58_06835 [Prevotella sp.]|nr:hypothetical protein [Prevotella sp.]
MDMQLEEMRQQMAILKEKLDKQEIINDQLMRKAVGTKLRKIVIERRKKLFFILAGLIYVPAVLYGLLKLDLWFIIVTILFFAVGAAYDIYYTAGINDEDLQNKRLLETKERIIRMKRMNTRWLWFSIPFVIVWIATFFWQIIYRMDDGEAHLHAQPILIGGLVGGVIGGIIGTVIYQRQQHRASELIEDIEELTK